VNLKDKTEIDFATMNRRQRRSFRRLILREHRNNTRYWRRAWRGIIPSWQVVAIVKGQQKTRAVRYA